VREVTLGGEEGRGIGENCLQVC